MGHDRIAEVALEGQQQVLRATFPGIRNCVRELLGVRADALARKFHETHDMAVKDELERLLKEYCKLREPCHQRQQRVFEPLSCHRGFTRQKGP